MPKDAETTEVEIDVDTPIVVSIVDDTPAEDRNRKPLGHDALAKDDEAEQYSEGVKKRMGELRRQAHEERRVKEAAIRERDEAIDFAKRVATESGVLKKKLTHGEAHFASEVKAKATTTIEMAKRKYKDAYESGDADKMAEAQEELTKATIDKANAENWQNRANQQVNALQDQKDDVYIPQTRQDSSRQAPVDARASDWASENADWFGVDSEMTSLAYGVHERLLKAGVHPEEDADEYYEKINSEMRKRFPEYSWSDNPDESKQTQATKPAAKKPTTNVAPVTRTSGGKNKVVLTKTQVSLAEKFGLTPEQYARELIKLNGA